MFRLLSLYSHVEPILFLIAGQDRAANEYCRPSAVRFRDALAQWDKKDAVTALCYEDSYRGSGRLLVRNGHAIKKAGGRYHSLNICPWLGRFHRKPAVRDRHTRKLIRPTKARDSTVEFRLHRNTLDPDRVIGWAHLCIAIVDAAARLTDKEAAELTKLSALRALCRMAPSSKEFILSRLREWRQATRMQSRKAAKRRVRYEAGKGWSVCAA
jgi:hypothetical protein